MQVTAINPAEAIFEPFWDPQLRELDQWDITLNESTGSRLIGDWWCSVNFEWQRTSEGDAVVSMHRSYSPGLDVSRYDLLLLSAMVPNGYRIRIEAETDCGLCSITSTPFELEKRELALPLEGGRLLQGLRITILAAESSSGMGWLNWAGLQSSERLPDYLEQFRHHDARWEGSLYPDVTPSFSPKYGIFFSEQQLESMRALYQQKLSEGAVSPFAPNTDYDKYFEPEKCINDFVNFWDDTRYCRERDTGKFLIRNGLRAALYGALEKDADSLRLAARYAMSILACTHWDDGMICDFPVGSWEHRCFVQSLCLYDLVFIYDLAWEYFTPAAEDRLFRRLAEEGLASINFTTWKHAYIFENNQLMWFSHGRMAAYALLMKKWPRALPYMETAYQELVENLRNTVLPDGGYVEGPTYFTCVGQNAGQALYLYARAKGKDTEEVVPDNLQASAHFADALYSTDREQDMIPICDARPMMPQSHLAFMSCLLKNSRWVNLFQRSVQRSGGMADDYFALMVQSMELQPVSAPRPFVLLPEMQLAASHRSWNGKDVKLLVMGNRSGAGHTHEDKGSFVLEYAGQTFAMDPGTCDYSSSYSMLYKHCQRHNVLVPAGSKIRPSAESPCMETIAVKGTGDAQTIQLSVDAGKAYGRFYEHWNRTIRSDSPDCFVITDDYALKEGCGCDRVEFLWNTLLPVEHRDGCVLIRGEEGSVSVTIPEGCRCELRRLEMFGGAYQNQIALIHPRVSGKLEVQIRLL